MHDEDFAMLRREVPPRLDGAVATELGVDVIMAKANRNNADIQRRLAGNLRIPKEDDIMFKRGSRAASVRAGCRRARGRFAWPRRRQPKPRCRRFLL